MKLKTKLVGQTITTMPPKDIRRADGTPNELMHDAACAHALMLELDGLREAADMAPSHHDRQLVLNLLDVLERRATEKMKQWGFDSGEDAS